MFDPNLHHRRSIRWRGYDYRLGGAYFVTLCADGKRCVFGHIENERMVPNRYGAIVQDEWRRTAELRANVMLDEWVIIPNHFHAIVLLRPVDALGPVDGAHTKRAHCNAPLQRPAQSLASLISGFKGAVTRAINSDRAAHNRSPVHVWQRNYYERVIRDEHELLDTRRYIIENPLNWPDDPNHPTRP